MGRMKSQAKGTVTAKAAIAQLEAVSARVGWFPSAVYPSGQPVAYVASIQEFGTDDIPARPFMRTTAAERAKAWSSAFGKGAKGLLAGKATGAGVMESIGLMVSGDIRKTIAGITAPPLAESTIAARLRGYKDKKTGGNLAKPLVHTALMINSLTYEVTA